MAFFVDMKIAEPRLKAVYFRRNRILGILLRNIVPNLARAVSLITQDLTFCNIKFGQKFCSYFGIADLTTSEHKADRISQSINNSVNFCGFSASARADMLVESCI